MSENAYYSCAKKLPIQTQIALVKSNAFVPGENGMLCQGEGRHAAGNRKEHACGGGLHPMIQLITTTGKPCVLN